MTAPALAVFLKAPRIGTVKTRLASTVGDRHALRLYRAMAARTLAAARASGMETTIWFAPADAAGEMRRWLGGSWELRPQCSGDLGARLRHAALVVDHGRAWMAIGADCPRLTTDVLHDAASVLARGEVAIGPTVDGGYYLIGGTTPLPDLFTAMPWSTSGVLHETRERLRRAGLAWHELAELRDVDTADDARAEGLLT